MIPLKMVKKSNNLLWQMEPRPTEGEARMVQTGYWGGECWMCHKPFRGVKNYYRARFESRHVSLHAHCVVKYNRLTKGER